MSDDRPGDPVEQPGERPPPPPPPPSPYGAPPSGPPGPPPGYPAYPPTGPYRAHSSGGNARIWIGIALAIPGLVAVAVLAGALGAVDSSGATSGLVVLAAFVAPIVMLFFDKTRKVAIGLLIGVAIAFILFAGACIALIASYQ